MPLLDDHHVACMLRSALKRCARNEYVMDYCRSCDEFYWLDTCSDLKHFGHRLTIMPFVEVRR